MATPDKHCAYCGKPAHKALEKIWNPHVSQMKDRVQLNGTREDWIYMGESIVVRSDKTDPGTWGSKDKPYLHSVTVWDGNTWVLNRDPFCTVTCAESFANAAFNAGYRMMRNTRETP